MPMSKRQKRNYNRDKRYGSGWRQAYYDADGICADCGSPDNLEFHHDNSGKLKIVCRTCHAEIEHEGESAGRLTCQPMGRYSVLAQDIEEEVRHIGLGNWKKLYGIKEKK